MLDHTGTAPWDGSIDSTGALAGLSREVAANDWQWRRYAEHPRYGRADERTKRGLFDVVLDHTPAGEVRKGIQHAAILPFEGAVEAIVSLVGNGSEISCQDTLPFCLWSAAARLDDYFKAFVRTIRGLGDVDTNAAIVGGIVALAVGRDGIPADWLAGREELVTGY